MAKTMGLQDGTRVLQRRSCSERALVPPSHPQVHFWLLLLLLLLLTRDCVACASPKLIPESPLGDPQSVPGNGESVGSLSTSNPISIVRGGNAGHRPRFNHHNDASWSERASLQVCACLATSLCSFLLKSVHPAPASVHVSDGILLRGSPGPFRCHIRFQSCFRASSRSLPPNLLQGGRPA